MTDGVRWRSGSRAGCTHLRSVVVGLSARGGWPAQVTLGEEGVEICGWISAGFGNPLTRLVSRLAQVLSIDPGRAGLSSLAFGRGLNLVWFAEGERSPTGSLQSFEPGMECC